MLEVFLLACFFIYIVLFKGHKDIRFEKQLVSPCFSYEDSFITAGGEKLNCETKEFKKVDFKNGYIDESGKVREYKPDTDFIFNRGVKPLPLPSHIKVRNHKIIEDNVCQYATQPGQRMKASWQDIKNGYYIANYVPGKGGPYVVCADIGKFEKVDHCPATQYFDGTSCISN